MKPQDRFLSLLFVASTTIPVACGGGSSASKGESSAKQQDSEDKGDAKAEAGEAKGNDDGKPKIQKREFKKFADGEAPVELSGWGFKVGKNFLGAKGTKNLKASFKIKVLKKVEQGSLLTVKSTCKLGDEYLADATSPLAQFDKLEPGETKETNATLYIVSGLDEAPEVCEVSVFLGKILSADPAHHLADYCYKGGAVTDGKCEGFTRPAGDGTPLKITKAAAKLEKIRYGDAKGRSDLRLDFTVLLGNYIERDKGIFVKSACQVGEDKIVEESGFPSNFAYLEPGDSMRVNGSTNPAKGIASVPSQCDLSFMLKGPFDGSADAFATYCFKDGKLNEGKCG